VFLTADRWQKKMAATGEQLRPKDNLVAWEARGKTVEAD
jgi:hypothetical protein